jgi:ABC-2 type transport system ATP-binding protein
MSGPAVQVAGVSKWYGARRAVDDVSFDVAAGEIFGVLGPNGAGKTTLIECLETLRRPDRGSVRVLGLDPRIDGRAIRARIGVQLQSSALPERLVLWEALDLFGAFYPRAVDWRPLLHDLGLDDSRDVAFGDLSGGQRQRAFVALALINRPEIVFLDELTTSLDPHGRRAIWDLVRRVRQEGATVFLTTHFMEEAERLCDRVAIMHHGRVIALDSPANLIRALGVERRVVFTSDDGFALERLRPVLGGARIERDGDRVVVCGDDDRLLGDVVGVLSALGIRCRDVHTEQATLEDVFLALTGDRLAPD